MTKTNILFLKPGGSVKFNDVSLGYTLGIAFVPDNEVVNLKNQRYKGFVDSKIVSVGGTVRVNALEISAANYALLPLTNDATLTKGILEIYGKRMDGVFVTIIFKNACVESIGEMVLNKSENTVLPITWRCLLDSEGILGTIVETGP